MRVIRLSLLVNKYIKMADSEKNQILEEEKEILNEEKEILAEVKNEEKEIKKEGRSIWVLTILICLVVLGIGGGFLYLMISNQSVYTENAQISAPNINLSSVGGGVLQEVYVHEGDFIKANTVVARVGNELIKTKVDSEVLTVNNDIGKIFNPGETIATVIDPTQLRVVGQVDENKGLNDVNVGQEATFTVDAFGSKKYYGVVDEVSPTSVEQDVVFNVSDARQTNKFDVKVRFDESIYPELKNGMSAKLWVYKN